MLVGAVGLVLADWLVSAVINVSVVMAVSAVELNLIVEQVVSAEKHVNQRNCQHRKKSMNRNND